MSNTLIHKATDIRQSTIWQKYMSDIGWHVVKIDETYIFVNRVKLFKKAFAKIQHPKGPVPVAKIDAFCQENKIDTVVIEPHSSGHLDEPYLQANFKHTKLKFASTATILIDLELSSNDLLKSFSENARRNIHKAQANKLITKIIDYNTDNNYADFQTYFKLMLNVGKKRKFYIPSYKEMLHKYDAFGPNQFLAFAYLPDSTDPIATVWYGYYEKTLIYLHTGINQVGYQQSANYLLVWEGLQEGQRRGLSVFDFEAIYDERYPQDLKRWTGFTQFKKRFHGENVYYPQPFIKNYSLFGKIIFR